MSINDYQRMLKLLGEDIATVPAEQAERAADHWIKTSSYMPKAADIHRLARNMATAGEAGQANRLLDQATRRNAEMDADPSVRQDIRWVQDGLGLRLVPMSEYRALKSRHPA